MPSGILQGIGAIQQAGAAKDASAEALGLTQDQMRKLEDAGYNANDILSGALPGVMDNLSQGYNGAADFATQGLATQRGDILNAGDLATGAITQGMGGSLDALYGGANQGIAALNDRQDRAGAMLDRAGGLYGDLQMDPGYQFGLNQGLDALDRRLAARGGRASGAAMQAINNYAQDYATQHYNDAAARRLQEYNAALGSDSQALNATSQAANMAYGTGTNAANIYGSGADRLAGIYGSTGAQLGAQAAGAGQQLGQLTQDFYGGLSNLGWNAATAMGSNLMSGAGAAAGLTGAANQAAMGAVPYAGAGWTAAGNSLGHLEDLAATAAGSQAGK